MATHPTTPTPRDGTPAAGAGELADWIATDSVPALEGYRQELAALAGEQPAAGPVSEQLLEVIAALNDVGEVLRGEDVLPSSLAAALARCSADIGSTRAAVARTRRIVDAPSASLGRDAVGPAPG